MENGAEPKVLAIILNYMTYELTIDLVRDLKNKIEYDNYDILVVDNASPNESAKILKKASEKDGFIFIANDRNSGYAAGNNIGLRYAVKQGYKYSWVLNNDLRIIDENILKYIVQVAESELNVACVGPRITNLDGSIVLPYIRRPTLWSLTLGIYSEKKEREKYKLRTGKVYRIYGCCMLLNNYMMSKIDYMDERTFLYYEEDIMAEKLLKIGAYSYYCPDTNVVHLESMTVNKEKGKRSYNKIRVVLSSMNVYLKYYRHYGMLARSICLLFRMSIMLIRK